MGPDREICGAVRSRNVVGHGKEGWVRCGTAVEVRDGVQDVGHGTAT